MALVEFKVIGLKETQSALKKFTDKVIKNSVRKATRAGLQPILELARSNLLPHRLTGDLYKSMHITAQYNRYRKAYVGRVTNRAATFYARFLEFGSMHQLPARWLGRAFDAGGRRAIGAFEISLKATVENEARAAAAR